MAGNMTSPNLENPLLTPIFDDINSIIPCTHIGIYFLEGIDLRLIAYRGPIPSDQASMFNFPLEKSGGARWVIQHESPLLISDTKADTAIAHDFLEATKEVPQSTFDYIGSWIGFPLRIGGRITAMLDVAHTDRDYYSEEHIAPLKNYINQVAVTIENAILYANLNQSSTENQILYSVQQAIYSHLDMNVVLQLIADQAYNLTSARQIIILLRDEHKLKVISSAGNPGGLLQPGYSFSMKNSLTSVALRTDQPVRVFDAANDTRIDPIEAASYGIRSMLVVPLKTASIPVGSIMAINKVFGAFSQKDERMLSMLAAGATIGLENAHLYREERNRRFVAEGLQQILAQLSLNQPLENILNEILVITARLFKADAGTIFQIKSETDQINTVASYAQSASLREILHSPISLHARMEQSLGSVMDFEIDSPDSGIQKSNTTSLSDTQFNQHPYLISDLIEWLNEPINHETSQSEQWINSKLAGVFSSALITPLKNQEKTIGLMDLFWFRTRSLTSEEYQMAETISKYVSLAIDRDLLAKKAEELVLLQERQRIAQTLHDTVAQMLFRIGIETKWCQQNLVLNNDSEKRINLMQHLISRSSYELRSAIFALGDHQLSKENSLVDLLQAMIIEFQNEFEIKATLISSGDLSSLSLEIKEAIYRIVREALTNISKHADASAAMVSLCQEDEMINITIQDNGSGLSNQYQMASIEPTLHFGINSMRQLITPLGGEFIIQNNDDNGVTVKATFPYRLEK